MDYKGIKVLLDKYFDGETSLQEESQLQRYFQEPEVHPSLRSYKPMFEFFYAERERHLSSDFETRLLEKLQQTESPRMRVVQTRIWITRVAAALILAAGIWWVYPKLQQQPKEVVAQTIDWSKYEPETPEEAYKILKTSLHKVSNELNDGAEKAAKEVMKVKKMNEVLN